MCALGDVWLGDATPTDGKAHTHTQLHAYPRNGCRDERMCVYIEHQQPRMHMGLAQCGRNVVRTRVSTPIEDGVLFVRKRK